MTKTQIVDWSKLENSEEKLTSDHLELIANVFERTRQHYMASTFTSNGPKVEHVEQPISEFKGFREFDLPICIHQVFADAATTGNRPDCSIVRKFFVPIGRNDVFFDCIRPFRSEHGYPLDRWCISVIEVSPNLLARYMLKRSALESGDWVDIDRRLRAFFLAMRVKD